MTKFRHLLRTAFLGCLVMLGAFAGSAGATHDEPGRGKALKASFVTSYKKCTSPTTVTEGGFPVPACAAQRSDPICGFAAPNGMIGTGKAKGVVRDGDVEMTATLSGLGLGCEGEKLCGVVFVRVTTERCSQPPCTTIDLELVNESASACCTVMQGRCRLKTTVNAEFFDALRLGQRAGIELLGCGLRRQGGPTSPELTFACGMLAP